MELANLPPAPFVQNPLEKRRSKLPEFEAADAEQRGRSASKVVSNSLKALTNVTTHFSKLNPMSKFRSPRSEVPPSVVPNATVGNEIPQINIDSQQ